MLNLQTWEAMMNTTLVLISDCLLPMLFIVTCSRLQYQPLIYYFFLIEFSTLEIYIKEFPMCLTQRNWVNIIYNNYFILNWRNRLGIDKILLSLPRKMVKCWLMIVGVFGSLFFILIWVYYGVFPALGVREIPYSHWFLMQRDCYNQIVWWQNQYE